MLKSARMRLVRKLFLLGVLLTGFAYVSSEPKTQAAPAFLICCSACETDPLPPPCRHGCSPSC